MSRLYEMRVEVRGYLAEDRDTVEGLCKELWNFDAVYETSPEHSQDGKPVLYLNGRSFLCGGESEYEFARRLARHIWAGLWYYCPVEVNAACLEYLPYESHFLGPDEYGDWAASVQGQGENPPEAAE